MGAVSGFTTGNYHCKPLMTGIIVMQVELLYNYHYIVM